MNKEPSTLTKKSRAPVESTPKRTKKDQIISLFTSGVSEIGELSGLVGCKPSYVASVLQSEGLMTGYFDLYTHSSKAMNIYSKFFAGRLGFKNPETARESVELIDRFYHLFEGSQDRAGQHHALSVALIMYNRARWSGKGEEAEIFRRWLAGQLNTPQTGLRDSTH
jgi:hypothetical protein